MSLGAALNSAVSGLTAQSAALSVISANIANASTTGYKTKTSSFDALVVGNSAFGGGGAGAGTANGEGVTTTEIAAMGSQGEITSTSVTTNMAIKGSGYFVASANAGNTSPGADIYTRDGSWAQDANGYLVNASGDYLMGYATDANGAVASASAGALSGLSTIKIPTVATVTVTTTSTLVANLPADLAVGKAVTTSTNVVDSLGVTQQIAETWTKGTTDSSGNTTWNVALSSPTSTNNTTVTTGTVTPTALSVTFNSNGVLVGSSQTSAAGVVTNNTVPGAISGVTLTLNSGATNTFALNLAGLTQTASSSNNGAISITSNASNGTAAGSLAAVAVSKNGDVSATYSNGNTVVVAKVPIATFANEEGLTEVSGSTYSANLQSGVTTLSTAGSNGAGSIAGEALEGSTTDTATEFNKMIVAQQAYSAAAQVVTYVDKMFQSLIQAVG